jgi:hypothetical protein
MASGGETEKDPSALTPDMVFRFMEQRFADERRHAAERDLRYEQRFAAQQEALAEKKETTDARLDLLNESRQTIDDLVTRTMPRSETEGRFTQIDRRQTDHEQRVGEAFAAINKRLDTDAGHGAGLEKGWLLLGGAVALAAAIVGIVAIFAR